MFPGQIQRNGGYNNVAQSPRTNPTIRAGLTVQELKLMTAMRMAQSDDLSRQNGGKQNINLTSSYQTANPQQLRAAGIEPVVINERPKTRHEQHYGNPVNKATQFENNSYNHLTPTTPSLSPYHQQIISTKNEYFQDGLNSSFNQGSSIRNGRAIVSPIEADNSNKNSEYWKQTNNPNKTVVLQPLAHNSATLHDQSLPMQRNGNYPQNSMLHPTNPSLGFYPASQPLGPINRSVEAGANYANDNVYSQRVKVTEPEQLRVNISADQSNRGNLLLMSSKMNSEQLAFQVSQKVPTNPLKKSLSQSTLKNDLGGNDALSLLSRQVGNNPYQIPLGTNEPLERELSSRERALYGDDRLDESFLRGKVTANTRTNDVFPLLKSKTAPKLATMQDASPIASPGFKMFSKKNSLAGMIALREKNTSEYDFLASEMAESVLNTPSPTSSPRNNQFNNGFANINSMDIRQDPSLTSGRERDAYSSNQDDIDIAALSKVIDGINNSSYQRLE